MLLWLFFVATCILGMAFTIRRPEGIISLSFIACVVFLGFWAPQFYFQLNSRLLPREGLEKMILMANLCLLGIIAGYHYGSKKPRKRLSPMIFARIDYFWSGAALAVIGAIAIYALSRLPESVRAERSPTGPVVVIAFFAQALGIGFAFAYTGFIRNKRSKDVALACVTGIFMLYRIFVVAKRTAVLEAGLVVFGGLWFVRNKRPPSSLGLLALPAIAILLTVGQAYRRAMSDGAGQWAAHSISAERIVNAGISAYDNLDVAYSLKTVAYNETINGVMNMEAKSRTGQFDFGFVDVVNISRTLLPRQIFGDLRESLFGWYQQRNDAQSVFGFKPKRGTPPTGIATAYEAFWYFGCLEFFVYSYLVGRVHLHAKADNMFAQGIWPHTIFAMLNMVSHDTNRFPMAIIRILVMVIPSIVIARQLQSKWR